MLTQAKFWSWVVWVKEFFNCHHDQYQEAQHGLVKLFDSVLQTLTQRPFFPHIHCNTKLGRNGTIDLIDSPSGLGISLQLGFHFYLACIHTSPFKPIKSYRHRVFLGSPLSNPFSVIKRFTFLLVNLPCFTYILLPVSLIPLGHKLRIQWGGMFLI